MYEYTMNKYKYENGIFMFNNDNIGLLISYALVCIKLTNPLKNNHYIY